MKIEIQKGIDSEQWDHLTGWREQVFPVEGAGITWAETTWNILAFEGDDRRPVAHVGFGEFAVELDPGGKRTVVGVGGVVVRPEHQGRHIPELLFERLHSCEEARRISTIFALFCPARLVSYYGRYGYAKFGGKTRFRQAEEDVEFSALSLMFRNLKEQPKSLKVPSEPW